MTAKPLQAERINPFPTAMDFGAGKTVTYSNKVAPTARIYLHLICRKRFFRGASALIPIRFLRQPDRWMTAKPLQAERINPFPTAMDFGAGKTVTYSNKVAPTARIYLHLICRKRFFRGASALIPIRFLRQPDRWMTAKPLQAERINPFPTILFQCRLSRYTRNGQARSLRATAGRSEELTADS